MITSRNCFVLDLDGVVYHGKEAIPGSIEAIAAFRKAGKRVLFLSNNCSSPSFVWDKLIQLGISCQKDEVITAGEAAVQIIYQKKLDAGKGVFVVGTDDLKSILRREGVLEADPQSCGALLVGMHPNLTYEDITKGFLALERGATFIACHRDSSYPTDKGVLRPGCGAMVGALEGASRRKVDFEIGKPNTLMLEMLLDRLGLQMRDCVIFGDSLDSDILMARRAGVLSVWVSQEDRSLESIPEKMRPDYQVENLLEVVKFLSFDNLQSNA